MEEIKRDKSSEEPLQDQELEMAAGGKIPPSEARRAQAYAQWRAKQTGEKPSEILAKLRGR